MTWEVEGGADAEAEAEVEATAEVEVEALELDLLHRIPNSLTSCASVGCISSVKRKWSGAAGCVWPSAVSEMVTDVARERVSIVPPTDMDVDGVLYPGSLFMKRWVFPFRRSSSVKDMGGFPSWWR